jgi:hypothetical protein
MIAVQVFQLDGKPDITGSDYILDFEICEFDIKSAIFNNFGIFLCGLFGKIAVFGSCADNFA